MARPTRRGTQNAPNPATALVLDSEGLNRAAQNDHRAVAWLARARELQLPVVVNAVTLAETLRGSARDAKIHWVTRRWLIEPVDKDLASAAGALLGATQRDDTIDAVVAVTAIRLNRPVTILTSDPADLRALTSGHPQISVVGL